MRNQRFLRILLGFTLFGALAGALPACGGGGGGGGSGTPDLYLQSFLILDKFGNQLGGPQTTEVYRDARLLFTFNTAVDFASVSDRTIKIGQPTQNNLMVEARGRFEPVPGNPNQVIFNPTSTTVTNVEDNPFGFEANAFYDVIIDSVLSGDVWLRNTDGDGIVQSFTTNFTTGIEYSQDFQQPEFIDSTPADGAVEVESTADVVMNFTHPMRPDSFVLGDTLQVLNVDTGRNVVGTVRSSPDAKTITYRPLLGYGPGKPDPNNPGQFVGYDIRVTVSREVISFSGNPIPKDVLIRFRTKYDPTQPIVDERVEEFDTTTYQETDPTVIPGNYPLADWNAPATLGLLSGLVGSGTITLFRSNGGNFLFPPWGWGFGGTNTKFHAMYTPNDMGTQARTITGYDWYYNASQTANNASNVSINMGHTDLANLQGNFPNNFQVGGNVQTPTTVVNNIGTYNIPQGGPSWLAGPTFQRTHVFQGGGLNYLMEIVCSPGTGGPNGNPRVTFAGAWGVLTSAPEARVVYTLPPSTTGNPVRYYIDTRWYWLITHSEAQSKFYDIGQADPTYLDALIAPDVADQPVGTTSVWEFEGAKEDANNPGNPDLGNLSGWKPSLQNLSGYRYIRFRVTMGGNVQTNQAPSYERIIFPYIFFQN